MPYSLSFSGNLYHLSPDMIIVHQLFINPGFSNLFINRGGIGFALGKQWL